MMKIWNNDLSLGIDISDQHISAVLLSRHRDKITVVKAASQRLAASAFGGDGSRTAQKVGKTLRQLLNKAGIRTKDAWISFGSPNLLLQMVDMPEQVPGNLGQYLRRQIRNSTFLSSKNPCVDFAAMEKHESRDAGQCFVAAIDPQPIETLIKSLGIASVNPYVIDIPVMSLYRAFYKKQLSHGYKYHTLLFYQHGRDVYLAVLRKASLDYIRHLERIDDNQPVVFEDWSMEHIRAVIQYYETEFMAQGQEELPWQFILASESHSPDMEKLKEGIEKAFARNTVYLSDKNATDWLPFEANSQIDSLPLAAAGAALRKWFGSGLKTEIDLLPEQTRKVRFVANYLINTAKIAAAAVLLLTAFVYLLDVRAQSVFAQSGLKDQKTLPLSIEQILSDKQRLADHLELLTLQKEQMQSLAGGYSVTCMADMMEEIRQRTPAAVCMTRLWATRQGEVGIEGTCPDMENIQMFARLLESAELVKGAVIRQSETHPQNPNLKTFTIMCTLREKS